MESQMRLDDKFHTSFSQTLSQCVELHDRERQSRMGHRHLVTVHGVVVVDASVIVAHPMADDLMAMQGVILPFFGGPAFGAAEDVSVKVLRLVEAVNRERVVERRTRRGSI